MNCSTATAKDASKNPSIKETTRYFINIRFKLVHNSPELRLFLLKKKNIIKENRLAYNIIVGNKGNWPLFEASCRHVPPRH